MIVRRLLVFGSGALAGEIVRSLVAHVPQTGERALSVTIASRCPDRARWVAAVARTHADALGRTAHVEAAAHDWSGIANTAALIDASAPDLVLHAASLQSAWSLADESRWSRFVALCGYGVTTPLQLALARHIQQAIAASARRPRWINGCYPDLVNAALAYVGEPPLCGLGNVALLSEHVRLQLRCDDRKPVRLVAAHADVQVFQRSRHADEPLPAVWIGEDRVAPKRLAALDPLPTGVSLNAFNAAEGARLVWAVLDRQAIRTHAPGPNGLVGGYPIEFDGAGVGLNLPVEIDARCAVTMNCAAMVRDGVTIDTEKGIVRFERSAREALAVDAPKLADGFQLDDIARAVHEMLATREAWIAQA